MAFLAYTIALGIYIDAIKLVLDEHQIGTIQELIDGDFRLAGDKGMELNLKQMEMVSCLPSFRIVNI